MKSKIKIAVFFGGKISRHLVLIRKAAKEMRVDLELVSYNRVCFGTDDGRVKIRKSPFGSPFEERGKNDYFEKLNDFDVVFFRTTGKHWEEVDLLIHQLSITNYESKKKTIVVDPLVESGKPSYACKAWQMLKLKEAGINVPRTTYGSLWYLYQFINYQLSIANSKWKFPVIVKGSGGDRGTRVFKANNLNELEKLVRELRRTEIEEGKRYMLQEFIENDGDFRVLVLGDRVLGVMKRVGSREGGEFRNNFSTGGKVEVTDLPQEIKQLAIEAAKVCGLMVAGVDIMPLNNEQFVNSSITSCELKKEKDSFKLGSNPKDYVVLEVNKGPQFWGFMQATGIDVPKEIVKFLMSLKKDFK